MAGSADDSVNVRPAEEGRLGQDVDNILSVLADMVEYVQRREVEDVGRRVFGMADFAIHGVSYLAKRKEEIGRLSPAVARELRMAESIMVDLHSAAHAYVNGTVEPSFGGVKERPDVVEFPMSPDERLTYMERVAAFIRKRFPGDTATRWERMAEVAVDRESGESRIIL